MAERPLGTPEAVTCKLDAGLLGAMGAELEEGTLELMPCTELPLRTRVTWWDTALETLLDTVFLTCAKVKLSLSYSLLTEGL